MLRVHTPDIAYPATAKWLGLFQPTAWPRAPEHVLPEIGPYLCPFSANALMESAPLSACQGLSWVQIISRRVFLQCASPVRRHGGIRAVSGLFTQASTLVVGVIRLSDGCGLARAVYCPTSAVHKKPLGFAICKVRDTLLPPPRQKAASGSMLRVLQFYPCYDRPVTLSSKIIISEF